MPGPKKGDRKKKHEITPEGIRKVTDPDELAAIKKDRLQTPPSKRLTARKVFNKADARDAALTKKRAQDTQAGPRYEGIRRVGKRDPNAGAPTPMTDKEMTNQFGPPQLRKPIGKKSQQPTPGDRERLIKGRAPRHESVNPRSVTLENLRTLLEQDLDQAELVLAAKDMVDRIQKMAENLAEMQVEELMPLVDAMKEHFGPDVAQVFNSSVEATLQQALDTIKATRDGVDNAVLALTGEAPVQSDMGEVPAPEMGMDAEMEVPSEEDFGGDEAMAGDVPAIGREMKPESVSTSALAQAKKILMQGAKNGKVSKQAVKEAALALTQKKKS
jgi:hypothetical protein